MSDITPRDYRLLGNRDVNHDAFSCCGNEALVFLKCPACAHLMVFCYECDTLFPDLADCTRRTPVSLARPESRLACPACTVPFKDYYFLMAPSVEKYLPTGTEVVNAGFGHLLSDARRGLWGLE